MPKFNEFQKAAIRAYHNDEAKGLLEDDDEVDTQNISVGDSLFTFIIRELNEHMDIEEAIQRMEQARADIETVLHALTNVRDGLFEFTIRELSDDGMDINTAHRKGAPPLTLAFSRKNSEKPGDSDGKD
jgi:hypothetical protein